MEISISEEHVVKLKNSEALTKLVEEHQRDKEKSWKSNVTMEPLWFGTIIPLTMGISAFQNLFLERACTVELGYSTYDCFYNEDSSLKTKLEISSQEVVTSFSMVSSFVGGIFVCFVLLFFGPWSDASGRRKPAIIFPIFGMMITSVLMLLLQAFPKISSMWVIFIMTIPLSIGGSSPLLMMAAFSYLGDICFKTGRCATTVMGSNSAAITASTIIGSLLTPILLNTMGFVGLFAVSALLQLTSIIYVYCVAKDVNVSNKTTKIFDLKLPMECQRCLFRKRKGNKRWNVLLMVFVPCTTTITLICERVLLYLYLRHKFQWTEIEYGMFSAFRGIVQFFGTIVVVKILRHVMKLNEETIGAIGGISQFLSTIVLILSSEPWMLYLSPLLGIFSRAVLIAEKPVLNKYIVANEQGKLNSITAILDKTVALILVPLTHYLYFVTVSSMPKFFLFFGLLAAGVQIFCYFAIDKDPLKGYNEHCQASK